MKIGPIADEIFRELGEPTDLSIPPISYWIRSNIGGLNNYINSSYVLDETTYELSPELGEGEKAILKKMYMVYRFDILIKTTLAAASIDTVIELESDGSRIKKINKNEQSKTYISMRGKERDDLKDMITAYKLKNAFPMQVAGDDTVAGIYDPSRQYNRIKPSA